mmetsp:Transcript_1970/g.3278  ORF Transcript_1970/g.3278 Transcript_1970/m.3278 type:complete len:277 (+) Transcript_1970:54-884(+)
MYDISTPRTLLSLTRHSCTPKHLRLLRSRLRHRSDSELSIARLRIQQHGRLGGVHSAQNALRNGSFNLTLDGALDGASTISRIIACHRQPLLGAIGGLQRQLAVRETLVDLLELERHDRHELLHAQRVEGHEFINAVEELRTKLATQGVHGGLFDGCGVGGVQMRNLCAAHVGREDHNGVAEVHNIALGVRQTAIVQQLQKNVEDFRVGLLHLVKQHDRVRTAPHCLGQLTTFLEANVARRGADQSRHGVLLHVLTHVDSHDRILGVEHKVRQGLA